MALVTPIFNEDEFFERFDRWVPSPTSDVDAFVFNPENLTSSDFDVMIMVSLSLTAHEMRNSYGRDREEELRQAGINSGAINGLILARRCSEIDRSRSQTSRGSHRQCGRRLKIEHENLWSAINGCGYGGGNKQSRVAGGNRVACLDPVNWKIRTEILRQIAGFFSEEAYREEL